MPRYIDADALIYDLLSYAEANKGTYHEDGFRNAVTVVEDQPTANVVPVVRCKECKHSVKHQLGYGCGMNYHLATNGEWFCADGERRDDGEIH